ncbi:hypothetical protein ACFYUV_42315 [Nonomuraea sp. NPDC003560]|uniref:hypothetical protein n=1 Tax=Nonomuraea sp. NPDC003560 TaxID=3364341 RepID=UPI0036C3D3A8
MTVENRRRWNHNVYYLRILRAIPDGHQRALDVGCGEGMVARELRQTVPSVVRRDVAWLSQYRRRLLLRYSIIWRKPQD